MEWISVEKAPKDGTHLLLTTKGYKKRYIGWFYNGQWHWDGDYCGNYLKDPPTHFQFLPEPLK